MANWGALPLDLAIKIAEKIEFYEDFEAFTGVCTNWRCATKLANRFQSSPTQTPWLMLAEPPHTSKRRFYSLYNNMVRQVNLLAPPIPTIREINVDDIEKLRSLNRMFPSKVYKKESDWRYFSSRGWLICVTQIGLNIILMHPLSGKIIQTRVLPEGKMWSSVYLEWHDRQYLHIFHKFALSASPSSTGEYTLAMIFNGILAFWRSTNDEWIVLEEAQRAFKDVTFYKGEFYAVTLSGKVQLVTAYGEPIAPTPQPVPDYFVSKGHYYLVESDDRLLLVLREAKGTCIADEDYTYKTEYFKVWEVHIMEYEVMTEVYSLGNRSLFLGFNSSFSVEASISGCLPNCIYYTDDLLELYYVSEGGHDMGVYDLASGKKIKDYYEGPSRFSVATPPLWVEAPNS